MKKRQKGSITVEATLFLPLFFLAFVSIYSLISFTRAQLIVQYAADQAAKEVAQYSYILEKIGILDSLDGLNSRSEDFEKNIKSIEEQLQTIEKKNLGMVIAGILAVIVGIIGIVGRFQLTDEMSKIGMDVCIIAAVVAMVYTLTARRKLHMEFPDLQK